MTVGSFDRAFQGKLKAVELLAEEPDDKAPVAGACSAAVPRIRRPPARIHSVAMPAMPAMSELRALLRSVNPTRDPGTYVFATLPAGAACDPSSVVACVREVEGTSVVMAEHDAVAAGLTATFPCAWITLAVHSDLAAVGLTAAVAGALAGAGIACNVVAGVHHDHLFVPIARADDAMAALAALQQSAETGDS